MTAMTTQDGVITGRATGGASERASGVSVRVAGGGDVDAIVGLIGAWSAAGLTLARSHDEIRALIESFVVAEGEGGRVIACAAMEVCRSGVAEIRSVAVAEGMTRVGAGRAVVNSQVERASELRVRDIYLLTKTAAFFERSGFAVVPESMAPGWWVRERVIAAGRTLEGRFVMHRAVV